MLKLVVDLIIRLAKRTPYMHLYHADGTLYMERYWLVPRFMLTRVPDGLGWELKPWAKTWPTLRIHHIHTPDNDRHMHNHPWSFISLVLRGGYEEHRPLIEDPERPLFALNGREYHTLNVRKPGSVALRFTTDRHLIAKVDVGGAITLVGTAGKAQAWGFFTETGYVPWRVYDSCREQAIRER